MNRKHKPLLALLVVFSLTACGGPCTIEFPEDDLFSSSNVITQKLTDEDLCTIKDKIKLRLEDLMEYPDAYEPISFRELKVKHSAEVQIVLDEMRTHEQGTKAHDELMTKLTEMDRSAAEYSILHTFKAKNSLGGIIEMTYKFNMESDFEVYYESQY